MLHHNSGRKTNYNADFGDDTIAFMLDVSTCRLLSTYISEMTLVVYIAKRGSARKLPHSIGPPVDRLYNVAHIHLLLPPTASTLNMDATAEKSSFHLASVANISDRH